MQQDIPDVHPGPSSLTSITNRWFSSAHLLMKAEIQTIHHEGTPIAISCQGLSPHETQLFESATCLFYVQQGDFTIEVDQHRHTIPTRGYGLLRKYTPARTFAIAGLDGSYPRAYCFVLNDAFVRHGLQTFPRTRARTFSPRFATLTTPPLLEGLMQSVRIYLDQHQPLYEVLIQLKTQEALLAIGQADNRLLALFQEYSSAERADLRQFMQYHYLRNLPLQELARLSGRSLATFNREFRVLFGETPHRWLMSQRLLQAHQLLQQGKGRPSDVYLQVGFEDLAHFSRVFKNRFKLLPSQVYTRP